ncbi:MAG: tRNA uridine-5-carboxymethylaminomethyl(34) synthesis GTPase MnmE [Clostridiales bacterium]|nr:tRNA uridine-5-carboxymethylaminomethyl(34) synthesis GTPase MnmE [Clostridiales bacterium]MDY3745722.1 tRNA uridine-5-carboxymethylaminomethyl(34) synthesis GTPase MnmE [Lachnospiraceae bacterium]
MVKDTIAAISTGMTNSGIGKVRMSGPDAVDIIHKIYKSPGGKKDISRAKSHTIHYGYIYDGEVLIDEVLVLLMRAPKSYTTEDMVEIDCHGGVVVMKKLLDTVIKYGARPAEPGEFTKRAFLNGRIDLTQAEAVIDVINSKSEMALSNSVRQLKGNILNKVKDIRKSIIGHIAFIEAAMDDPEHINADHFGEELKESVIEHIHSIEKLLASSDNGRMIKEGIKTVIVGKPNAGKSSLLNVLVGDERAIVTNVAGTTRDTLEEFIQINGIPLNIIDTAGIRDTEDIVEKIGVDKAKNFAEDADLVIYVVDGSTNLDDNDRAIIEMIKDKKVIVLINKIDLHLVTTKEMVEKEIRKPVIEISAKEEKGIDLLEKQLKDMFFGGDLSFNDEIYITNARQKAALNDALNSLKMVVQSIDDGMPEDFYSIDLMNCYDCLGSLIGESTGEDLIDTIFSDFCMGK